MGSKKRRKKKAEKKEERSKYSSLAGHKKVKSKRQKHGMYQSNDTVCISQIPRL